MTEKQRPTKAIVKKQKKYMPFDRAAIAARTREVAKYWKKGVSAVQISGKLDIHVSTVYADIDRAVQLKLLPRGSVGNDRPRPTASASGTKTTPKKTMLPAVIDADHEEVAEEIPDIAGLPDRINIEGLRACFDIANRRWEYAMRTQKRPPPWELSMMASIFLMAEET